MTHKEFYFWLEGYLHDKKISSYDEAATFLLVIKEKMNEVKDVENEFPRISRTTVPSPFNPIIMPLKDNDSDPYKPPFTITCETKQQLND
jgi:hypothetical protein